MLKTSSPTLPYTLLTSQLCFLYNKDYQTLVHREMCQPLLYVYIRYRGFYSLVARLNNYDRASLKDLQMLNLLPEPLEKYFADPFPGKLIPK